MVVNRERLADVLGCSLRTVDEYVRQGMPGDPPKKGGDSWRFESAACIGWLRERERQSALGEIAKIDREEAGRRKLAAEAALVEHDLALKQRAAVAVSDFGRLWTHMIGASRAKLRGIGAKLGRVVALSQDAAECEALIDELVSEALQELSEFEPEIPVEPAGSDEPASGRTKGYATVGAPAEPDRKRVGGRRAAAQPRVKR